MSKVLIANASDATLCDAVANVVKSAEAAGLKAILMGAVFLTVRGDNMVNHNTLCNALAKVTSEGSAKNYASKARAAAMPEHWNAAGLGKVDVNTTIEDTVKGFLPLFRAYWQATNNVKKTGPVKATATTAAAAEPTAATASPPAQSTMPAVLVDADKFDATAFAVFLSGLDGADLIEASAMIAAELASREVPMQEAA